MMASQAGQGECVKVLLDRDAQVNIQSRVSVSLYTVYMQCSMYPESAVE